MSGSSSPDSSGPQRTYRSPRRHSPYSHSDRHSRNGENVDPRHPSQPEDFHSRYLPYSGSSSTGYDRTPLSAASNYDTPRRLPALTTIVNIDELSTEYGLDNAQRKAAHGFSRLGSNDRAVTLFLRLLQTEKQNNLVLQEIQGLKVHVDAIGAFCTQNWKPSKEQIKLIKSLMKHYIIRPITSYGNLVAIVETYIHDHAKRLHLELYKQDPTVKSVVRELLTTENNAVRSALRKLVFASVKDKTPLKTFSMKIINMYHLPTIPTTPSKDIMSCLALMRDIARPLIVNDTVRGGDTGFWIKLERELDTLFERNGNEREAPKWQEWEQEIIDADDSRYRRNGAESSARTREEINAAILPAPVDASGSGLVAPTSGEEENDEDTPEERDVRVSQLGNLAALSVGPVVRV
ncbi:hypothetical protein DFH09DRAFT_1383187 [Mycena vulgaris]|nr:hypothetical protein DFH09DRAFT_1383187 [Mycena vulgaris]